MTPEVRALAEALKWLEKATPNHKGLDWDDVFNARDVPRKAVEAAEMDALGREG